jgi:hypothetical protein
LLPSVRDTVPGVSTTETPGRLTTRLNWAFCERLPLFVLTLIADVPGAAPLVSESCTWAVAGAELLTAILKFDGLTVTPAGKPEKLPVTVPVKPLEGVAVTVIVCEPLFVSVTVPAERLIA